MQGYHLIDPRPLRDRAPYTFFVPGADEIAQVRPGLLVKLIFAADPPSEKHGAERMWVKVDHRDGEDLSGRLDNDPDDIPALRHGDAMEFKSHHIIAVFWEDPEEKARFTGSNERWFERCYVDAEVLEGTARVQYLYREAPEHAPDDRYPDTGWRLRADVSQLTDEQYETPRARYVAIGAALNKDDSYVDLLDAPIGSAFFRESGKDRFEATQRSDQD